MSSRTALKAGATDAEAVVYEGDEFSALVRLGQVETLKESGSRAVGLRVFLNSESSTHREHLLLRLLEREHRPPGRRCDHAGEDHQRRPLRRPAGARTSSASSTAICISTSTTSTNMPPAERIEIARRAKPPRWPTTPASRTPAARDFDTATSHKILMNSRGFTGEYRRSYCGFSVSPIAQDEKGGMQRNYWYSNSRTDADARRPRRRSAGKLLGAHCAVSAPAA